MTEQPQGLKKTTIPLTQSELDLIDLWAFENRVGSRISALRSLIGLGCESYFGFDSEDKPPNGSADASDGNPADNRES